MNTPRHLRIQFASWLDALVAGTSTPVNRNASDSAFTDLQRAAAQIHDLNRHVSEIPPEPSLVPTWETFMSSSPSIPIIPSTPFASRPIAIDNLRASTRWLRLDRASSLLIAAAMLIALTAGIWQASGGLTPGNDSPPPTDVSLGVLQATPGSVEPVDLPTAEDCTVEPLTVDEVLWYVTEPVAAHTNLPEPGQTIEELQTLEERLDEAFADVSHADMEPSLASHEDIAAAADTQRMWMACILAESYFQVWALESPWFVASGIINSLPPLTSLEEARVILEDLKANGAPLEVESTPGFQMFSSMSYPGNYGIQLISPDTANSWKTDAYTMALGYDRFEIDGTFDFTSKIFKYPTTRTVFDIGGSSLGCDGYRFDWNQAREMWLVSWAPFCG